MAPFLPCDAMQARPMPSCGVCLSVRLSVAFVHCVKTSNCIFKIVSPLGSQTVLVFTYQTSRQYSDGDSPDGASNVGGAGKNRDLS